jgi:hypothetical protein
MIRDMKKVAKIEYGIQIVKPWSKEMYDHNDEVAEVVREQLTATLEAFRDELDPLDTSFRDDELQIFGSVVVGFRGWINYENGKIIDDIEREIDNAPYYRLKEIAEELEIELEKGFVGF